jgi:hypothetical protein
MAGALLFAVVSIAPAQGRPPSAAERLFEEGRALDNRGMRDEACAKFEASETLEPAVGTLLNLATCAERKGQTATAWQRYREAAVLAGRQADAEREAVAKRGAAALEGRLSKLLLRVPTPPVPPSLVLQRDGVTVLPSDLGVAVAVDPGVHALTASAPGYRVWAASVLVGEGPAVTPVDVPSLEPQGIPVQPPPPPPAPPALPQPTVLRPPAPEPPALPAVVPPPSSGRPWAWVVGGAGAAALGAGIYFAVESRAIWLDVEAACPAGRCPSASTLGAENPRQQHAAQAATLGTIGLVVGGVALATSVLLYVLTSPHPSASGFTSDSFDLARGGMPGAFCFP